MPCFIILPADDDFDYDAWSGYIDEDPDYDPDTWGTDDGADEAISLFEELCFERRHK